MTKIGRYIFMFGLLGLLITACSDNDSTPNTLSCDDISGREYYSQTLQSEAQPEHSKITFSSDEVTLQRAGDTMNGEYRCEGGNVLLSFSDDGQYSGNFSANLVQLQLILDGEVLSVYEQPPSGADPQTQACEQVGDTNFEAGIATAAENAGEPAAVASPFFYFGPSREVDYSLYGDVIRQGIYDCDTGVLHVHRHLDDPEPGFIDVAAEGNEITAVVDGTAVTFSASEPDVCVTVYDPVCAVDVGAIHCITTPCPVGAYKTYANRCKAEADGALFVQEGECGEMEGQPYEQEPACTSEHSPVCAADAPIEPCLTAPCPTLVHRTFDNECEAQSSNAFVQFEGECGALAGTPVESMNGGCAAVFDPVCAKDELSGECTTEPCATHEYETFSNACTASMALATPVFNAECGEFAGEVMLPQPPVQLVDELPSTSKQPMVSNVSISNDLLFVTLAYAGCQQQHFDLLVQQSLSDESTPEASYVFKPMVDDDCAAAFSTEFAYDLLPLQHAYQEQFGNDSGEIILPDLMNYNF